MNVVKFLKRIRSHLTLCKQVEHLVAVAEWGDLNLSHIRDKLQNSHTNVMLALEDEEDD